MSVTGAQMALTVAGMRVNVTGHTVWSIFLASGAEAELPYRFGYAPLRSPFQKFTSQF